MGARARLRLEDVGWKWRGYQLRFLQDTSRLICVVKSRQVGFSEVFAFRGPCEAASAPGTNVYFVSTNYRKAKALLAKALKWARALALMHEDLERTLRVVSSTTERVEFANGSTMQALPCKASSVRGETGVIFLDEVDHYAQLWEVYAGIAPAITSNPNLRLIASTTPLGEDALTYKVFETPFGDAWSKHRITVYDAVADGFPEDVLDLRSSYTSDAWAQEFECAWISDRDRYFSNALLRKCAGLEPPERGTSSLGVDIGRTRDRSAWAEVLRDGALAGLVDYAELAQAMPHNEQFDALCAVIDAIRGPTPRITVDARGEGSGTADWLAARYGRGRVQGFKATAAEYGRIIPALKLEMECGRMFIPNDPLVYGAFGKIAKSITQANNVTFGASRAGGDHADIFYATLLAFARDYAPPAPKASTTGAAANVTNVARKRLKSYL